MKSINYIFAAALAVLACSCSKEQVTEAVPDGAEVGVTFTAELPGMQTKAIGDGLTAKNLQVAVYEDNAGAAGNYIQALDKTAQFTALKTNVEFNLVKGKTYHFIFWAQADNAPYTLKAAAKTVAIDYENAAANDENRDAFYAVKTLKVQGPATEPVQLKRPFAQVNFGTVEADFSAAVAGGVTVTKSAAIVAEAATVLDLFAGEGKDAEEVTYSAAAIPAEKLILKDGTEYKYLSMNYFVPEGKFAESHVTNVKAKFVTENYQTVEISVPSTPVQSNWRTNIVGNLLTDQVVFNVEIVPAFEDENTPVMVAAGQRGLDDILAAGVAADVKLAAGTYKLPAAIADGVSISGQTGAEVIDGSETAKVTAKDFSVSNVIVKGSGTYSNGSSLAIQGANSTVSNCTFKNGRQNTYGNDLSVSQPAGSVTAISGCDFRKSGFRGVMIWDTGDEVKIDNCLFDNTYPFNCDAGTGKITVTDSELNGWTSYTNTLESVTFSNCRFGKSTSGYAYLVPYCKTFVEGCTFSADFLVSPSGTGTFSVEFINCKFADGTPVDSSIMDTDDVNTNASWIIDGQSFQY